MDKVNEVLLINKPVGLTSFGVVARVRRVLSIKYGKKMKVGHTGTLDPFASGLMILLVGDACKKASQYSRLDKVYRAVIRLGQTSITGDPEGEITNISSRPIDKLQIEKVLKRFIGEIKQKPPAFSAIKVNGQRAYKLARQGMAVDVPERLITIYSLKLIEYNYPDLVVEAHVSSGTYIRTLAEDIGRDLGVGAYCYQLARLKVGKWSVGQSKTLSDMGISD